MLPLIYNSLFIPWLGLKLLDLSYVRDNWLVESYQLNGVIFISVTSCTSSYHLIISFSHASSNITITTHKYSVALCNASSLLNYCFYVSNSLLIGIQCCIKIDIKFYLHECNLDEWVKQEFSENESNMLKNQKYMHKKIFFFITMTRDDGYKWGCDGWSRGSERWLCGLQSRPPVHDN